MTVMTGGISAVAGVALYAKQALQAKKQVHRLFHFVERKTGLTQHLVGQKGFGGDHSHLRSVGAPLDMVHRRRSAPAGRPFSPPDQDLASLYQEIEDFVTDSDTTESSDRTSESDSASAHSSPADAPVAASTVSHAVSTTPNFVSKHRSGALKQVSFEEAERQPVGAGLALPRMAVFDSSSGSFAHQQGQQSFLADLMQISRYFTFFGAPIHVHMLYFLLIIVVYFL